MQQQFVHASCELMLTPEHSCHWKCGVHTDITWPIVHGVAIVCSSHPWVLLAALGIAITATRPLWR
eukprot:1458222-Amphidinium_carterae.1